MVDLRMTESEREAFLAEARNAVLSIAEPDGGTLASPVWFLYEPGGLVTLHLNDPSRKLTALERAGRATITVEDGGDIAGTGRPPKYLSATGAVVENRPFDEERDSAEVWDSITRYLGEEVGARYVSLGGEAYVTGARGPGLPRVIRIEPQRWFTRDYAKGGSRWDEVVGRPGASAL